MTKVAALAITVAFANISYERLETPILKLKERFTVVASRGWRISPLQADADRSEHAVRLGNRRISA